jgi:6-phosphogluconolactonase (cycloisomerase 2 family)
MNNRMLCPFVLTLTVLFALSIMGCSAIASPTPASSAQASASKFMYTALISPDGVGALHINGDGNLSPLPGGPFAAPPRPASIVGNSRFIFVAGFGSVDDQGVCCQNQAITTYKQDPVAGTLTQVASIRHDPLDPGRGVVLDPAGRFLYAGATNGSGSLDVFAVAEDGHLTFVGSFDFRLGALSGPVFNPTGRFLYVATGTTQLGVRGIYRFEIDPESGLPVDQQEIDTPAIFGVQLSPDGRFLLASEESLTGFQLCSFRLNPMTGLPQMETVGVFHQPTPVACIPAGSSPVHIAFHPNEKFVALAQFGVGGGALPGGVVVYRFDDGNFVLVPNPSFLASQDAGTITFSADGKFLFVSGDPGGSSLMNVFAFDQDTGALAPVSGSPFSVGNTMSVLLR